MDIELRKRRLASAIRHYDLQDLKGAEFQRQLRLAHDEGLLSEFLRDMPIQGHGLMALSTPRLAPANLSNLSPVTDQPHLQTLTVQIAVILLFQSMAATIWSWLAPLSSQKKLSRFLFKRDGLRQSADK